MVKPRHYGHIAHTSGKYSTEEIRERYKSGLRLVGNVDSGGMADRAAMCGILADIKSRKKYLKFMKYWKFDEKSDPPINEASMRDDIARMHEIVHFDFLGYEANNMGRSFATNLSERYGIRPYLYTTMRARTKETLQRSDILDKHQVIVGINADRQQGRIILPKIKTPAIQLLMREFDTYVIKISSGTGNRIYEAEGSNTDDGVAAFLGAWQFADRHCRGIDVKNEKIVHRNSSANPYPNYIHTPTGAELWEKIEKGEI
ncbi:MAG: hypothetical protein K8823_1564 [Cenarchaeum symbiont of Oopsacas minuta]|nr:hypothetical protein [Cenarchaeum symbiont of Oopsacas minuta]